MGMYCTNQKQNIHDKTKKFLTSKTLCDKTISINNIQSKHYKTIKYICDISFFFSFFFA